MSIGLVILVKEDVLHWESMWNSNGPISYIGWPLESCRRGDLA